MAGIIARPDKNEFLLYSMLDALSLARGNKDTHYIRRKVADSFDGYEGVGLSTEDYGHHSKPATYVLTLTEAPFLEEIQGLELDDETKSEIENGRSVLHHMTHFYNNTDFERVYEGILPFYKAECEFVENLMNRSEMDQILDYVWGAENYMEVIPMPLEGQRSGIGPSLGKTAYQIVGPPFDFNTIFLVAHEGSHPRAKTVIKPIADEVSKSKELLRKAAAQQGFPAEYRNWKTCFEEHLIRAVQACMINPELVGDSKPVEKQLDSEYKNKGMVYIYDFAEELKQKGSGSDMTETALRILRRLDKKYC